MGKLLRKRTVLMKKKSKLFFIKVTSTIFTTENNTHKHPSKKQRKVDIFSFQ